MFGKKIVIIYGKIKNMNNYKIKKIDEIINKMTPEKIKEELDRVNNIKLPIAIISWIEKYEQIGERKLFIWKWLWGVFQGMKMPLLFFKKYEKNVLEIKVLLTMFIVIIDDVSEKQKNQKLLTELLKIPFERKYIEKNNFNKRELDNLKMATSLWEDIERRMKALPKYEKYKSHFEFDFRQTINAIRYSSLINDNYHLLNLTECWIFSSYNMNIFAYSDIDLMITKEIKEEEIGKMRSIIYKAQRMTRIGNWVSTWEREVFENDFANGIFAKAIDTEIITIKELKNIKDEEKLKIIEKIRKSGIEKEFINNWDEIYNEIKEMGTNEENKIMINEILNRLEKVVVSHLSSKGYK